ncbi:hypothetical protein NE689_14665 [Lactonifactor longoviformis]|uniref:hypothetical protein n=1 Tax=Lactonifactor longoviformis TaxID=341220 RepID=UPI001D021678|nr:hypothetical protein [Lactonifactor longoviformis]MCB5713728.1 hypothetical protein [Lactonifactor longoviformis]MCB5715966.1 hypothetical protein [Lactonifactor longoviformis]MCQ4672565.1 hypothetical protein [Lactonifactor longoviformis]
MKYSRKLLLFTLLLLILVCLFGGCQKSEKSQVKAAATRELDLLKDLDDKTIEKYISYEDLYPSGEIHQEVSSKIKNIFSRFYENFSYKILDIQVKNETARVTVRLNTIDAETLAKDYSRASMKKRIASSANPEGVEYSLEDYYLLLGELLDENQYDTVENNCTLKLSKESNTWKLEHSSRLDDQLVGGFVSYLKDPNLFAPEEIVEIHFDTLKEFDTEQLNRYLGIDTLFDADDAYSRSLTQELTNQISDHFDYRILKESDDGHTATVTAEITSYDAKSILNSYEKKLDSYLNSSQAFADGESGRLKKSSQLLLNSIKANKSASSTKLDLTLINDGTSWKLQMNEDVAQAILGGMGEAVKEISSDVK